MAIALATDRRKDSLNTVAVVPFDIAQPTTSRVASASSSTTARSLVAAASNLINAIAQGSIADDASEVESNDAQSDSGSDPGSSSWTYTAPASASNDDTQQGWYVSIPYHISNRYYDVDITLNATKSALPTSDGVQQPSADAVLSQTYPAYLVVVDRSRSLDYHRTLATSLESKVAPGFDADISIVAGVSLISSAHPQLVTAIDEDQPSTRSSHRQQASHSSFSPPKTSDLVALYADHGWEFIAIDELEANDADDALSLGGGDEDAYDEADLDDDKDGIERIREALMNHMWNGLVRKDRSASMSSRAGEVNSTANALASNALYTSFSDAINGGSQDFDTDAEEPNYREASNEARHLAASLQQLPSLDNNLDGSSSFPKLDLDNHAEASDLDEQLAKLFLSHSNGDGSADLGALEAFLESQDPSWPDLPSEPAPAADADTAEPIQTFEDDFDDFLPFQSAPRSPAPPIPAQSTNDTEELPSMQDISQMRNRLFGSNAAARLEAGPLGMGSQPNSAAGEGDLASQLQQLQWHAQRVRNIQDPDQRRKEAALIALAFSMQWSTEDDDPTGAGGMTF